MHYEEKINILPYVFIIFILSSYVFIISSRNMWLAILIASCFFIFLIFKINLKLAVIFIAFFFMPLINNIYYYNLQVNQREEVRIVSINSYGAIGEVSKRKIYLSGNLKDINLGEKLIVTGEFTKEINQEKGIIGEFKVDNFKKLNIDLKCRVYRIRENIFNTLKEKLGYRRAAIVTSISFGYSDFLDGDDKDDMKNLGVLHAISVSGLHMVLVYSILKKVFGNKFAPIVSIIYVIFTGAALSTVRAYIMMLFMGLATPLRRSYNPIAALSISGIILVLYKPYSVFEVGFQLSFLATLGIIFFNKPINKRLYRLPKFLREGISICIASQVFTFPISIIYFKEISLGFLMGNLILLPLINIVVVLGNLLALLVSFKFIFNYLAFITYYVTLAIDISTEWLLNLTPNALYLNEIIVISYMITLITAYFYIKGYRRAIYLQIILIYYFYMLLYSPFPKLEYFKDGVIAISFKGERSIIAIKKDVDLEKYKIVTLSKNAYKDFKNIRISDSYQMSKVNKDIMLKGKYKSYVIKISKGKNTYNYDIIDIKSSNYSKIILLEGKILVFN